MIKVEGQNITVSRGDTLDVVFYIKGYNIENTDNITFSVKTATEATNILMQKNVVKESINSCRVSISATEMNNLPTGQYIYDLKCVSQGKVITFNFPALLTIKGVAHI